MKTISQFTLAVLILLAGSSPAWAALRADPAAVDLGRRLQEQTVAVEIKLTNNGATALEILSVTADCSCTVASPGRRKLQAGESTPLDVTMETRGFIGKLRRNIHVQSTAGDLTIPIDLNITLFKNWSIEPSTIVMPPSPKGKPETVDVVLRYLGEGRAELGLFSCTPGWLGAEAKTDDGRNFQVRFSKPADAPAGNYTVKVTAATSDPDDPALSFNVFVPITSSLRVSPNPIVLPSVKVGQPSTREITIIGWSASEPPVFQLKQGRVGALQRDGGKVTCEVVVEPTAPGPLTQLLRIYDGNKLEAEIPVIVRAEPADSPAR